MSGPFRPTRSYSVVHAEAPTRERVCGGAARGCVPNTSAAHTMWRWLVAGATIAIMLLTLAMKQPAEVQHRPILQVAGSSKVVEAELRRLRQLLEKQQAAAARQSKLVSELLALEDAVTDPQGTVNASTTHASLSNTFRLLPHKSAVQANAQQAVEDEEVRKAETKALDQCTEADVPILALLRRPCPNGLHGYGCSERWGHSDRYLPKPQHWLAEWNASARSAVNCQRGFFDAVADRMTRAHWEVEWDAQPFRIAATPPRTIGKMLHQIVTANYYHLTLPPRLKPPLRHAPLPGWSYLKTTQPGFRWNVLDYGADNVFADPLAAGRRCRGSRTAWHCLWQRFPQQTSIRSPPSSDSVLGRAASDLYNASMSGRHERQMLQYLIVGGVTQVFSELTSQAREYLQSHLKLLCHVSGPYCGGQVDAVRTPIVALHVRRGDSCDRERDEAGPFNSMFAWDAKKGKLDRVGFRYCYTWRVYREQLLAMRRLYGARTVLVATDDADGKIVEKLQGERDFNWAYLHYPRAQFKKRGWMEFRKDLTDDVPFSLAAAIELLGAADMLIGNMGSHVTRMIYNKMVGSIATSVMPPFLSVDGYGLCCDFTEECSREDIAKRDRPIRDCIHKYGQCTGGDQWFRWNG